MGRRLIRCLAAAVVGWTLSPVVAQEAQPSLSANSVRTFVTSDGEIVYYVSELAEDAQLKELAGSFEEAVRSNLGMKEFMQENPDSYLAAGEGPIGYTIKANQILGGTFEAEPFILAELSPEGSPPAGARILDAASLLSRLASNMLQDASRLSCAASIRPNTIEGNASMGLVSFSATWDVATLCE